LPGLPTLPEPSWSLKTSNQFPAMNIVQEHAAAEDKSFSLIQPGSSVATALSEGESKKKHVVLFEINRERYRTINYPLESVRPFIHDNVSCPCEMPMFCSTLSTCSFLIQR